MSTYNSLKDLNVKRGKKRKIPVRNLPDSDMVQVVQNTDNVNLEKILDQYVVKEDKILEENDAKEPRSAKKMSKKKTRKIEKIKERKQNSLPTKHPEAEERTIFVGNVSVDVKRRKVEKFFSKYGEVESVRFRGFAVENMEISKKEAIAKKKLHPGRKSLIAYVRFKDKTSKESALEANGEVFEGLHIRVDSSTDGARKEKNSIFVGNLPWEIEDEDLWGLFQDCGKIKNVRIVRSSVTGAGKGIGFVSFESKDGVDLALNFDGTQLKNRALRVRKAVKKLKEKKEVKLKRNKSGTSSLVEGKAKKKQKMKMSFMKQDKPSNRVVKEKHAKRKAVEAAAGDNAAPKQQASVENFIGKRVVADGRPVKKQKRTKRTKAEIKKFAFAKILANA